MIQMMVYRTFGSAAARESFCDRVLAPLHEEIDHTTPIGGSFTIKTPSRLALQGCRVAPVAVSHLE